MSTSHPFPATARAARLILARTYDTVRAHVHRIGDAARHTFDRIGTAAESYVGGKIERRVKPPIVAALLAAGVALAVALVAVFRK